MQKRKPSTSSIRDRYLAALDLPDATPDGRPPLLAALNRAHELRKFEIENYWKRSNYFWLFQAAAITLTGLIYSKSQNDGLLLLSCGLGVITAQVAWLTARGSKFWQSNWEAHVDFLEPEVEGKLTQIILYQEDSVRSSVSKVNERLYALLLLAWLALFLNNALLLSVGVVFTLPLWMVGLGSILLLAAAMSFVTFRTRSSLNPSSKTNSGIWNRLRGPSSSRRLEILDRSKPAKSSEVEGDASATIS